MSSVGEIRKGFLDEVASELHSELGVAVSTWKVSQ